MKNKSNIIKLFSLLALLLAVFSVSAYAGVHGDIDNDGKASAADARLALRAAVGLESFAKGSAQFAAADVDSTGNIEASDARLILRASVSLEQLSHSYGAWVKETKANGAATGYHYSMCLVCGDKKTEVCKFGDKVYTKAATCTAGSAYYTECSVCHNRKAGGDVALGHIKSQKIKSVDPTCTAAGSVTYTCNRCKKNIDYPVAAKGHTPDRAAADCEHDKICSVCRVVLEAKHHTPGPAATCLGNQVCTLCGKVLNTAKGHDMSGTPKASCTVDQICPKCKEVAVYAHHTDNNGDFTCDICKKDMPVERFNARVNVLKDGTHTAAGFLHTKTENKLLDSEVKYSTGFQILINTVINPMAESDDDKFPTEEEFLNMLKEGFGENDDSYSLYALDQKAITKDNFTIQGNTKVSELVNGDVSEIKEETVSAIDFLSELGDTIPIGKSTYSLARFKNAVPGEMIKTTVKIKQEKYSVLKNKENPTALMRFEGTNIRKLATEALSMFNPDDFGGDGELFSSKMDTECKELVSDANVVFYFDAETKLPIAAKYSIGYDMTDHIGIEMTVLGEKAITGHLDFENIISDQEYFFFDPDLNFPLV